jgi:hypothetical protein
VDRKSINEISSPSETVPLEWPAMRADSPPPVRTIRGLPALPAMVLLWFAPKRMGPFVAAAGWHAAVWASLIGIGIGLGLPACGIVVKWISPRSGPCYLEFGLGTASSEVTLDEMPRAPLAALVAVIHTEASKPGWSAASGCVFLLTFAAILVASFLALAATLMPFAAAGEPLARLFGRCLRLVLWSMTILIPIGVLALYWPRVLDYLVSAAPPYADQEVEQAITKIRNNINNITLFVLLGLGVWWLWVLWRSGLRYAGPADGPAWRPRTPRCRKCGYIIATLRIDARCPECNHPVADSMAWVQRRSKPTRLRLFTASVRDAMAFGKRG